jgi:hypothetical protein
VIESVDVFPGWSCYWAVWDHCGVRQGQWASAAFQPAWAVYSNGGKQGFGRRPADQAHRSRSHVQGTTTVSESPAKSTQVTAPVVVQLNELAICLSMQWHFICHLKGRKHFNAMAFLMEIHTHPDIDVDFINFNTVATHLPRAVH